MNSTPGYNQNNFGCDNACHANDADHQLSDSGLPVELKAFGTGGAVPHAADGSFFNPSNHGPAAKGLTAAFPNGLANCRVCHAEDGVNPRFNVDNIVGVNGTGCEACHNEQTAHPSDGAWDKTHWYDGVYRHGDIDADKFTTMCTICHGTNLGGPADGGVGPACTACHVVDPVANSTGCVSCHNLPPDSGALAGDVRPNRQGQHNRAGHSSLINVDPTQTCSRCHNGAGMGTSAHFDTTSPADVQFLHPDPTDTISADSTADNTTCNGACHVNTITVTHTNSTWYPAP